MLQERIRPFTEGELYKLPAIPEPALERKGFELKQIKSKGPRNLVVPPFVEQAHSTPPLSFWEENKTLIIVSGVLLLLGAGYLLYEEHQKQKNNISYFG